LSALVEQVEPFLATMEMMMLVMAVTLLLVPLHLQVAVVLGHITTLDLEKLVVQAEAVQVLLEVLRLAGQEQPTKVTAAVQVLTLFMEQAAAEVLAQ
jgi:hypothetical protein